MRPLRIHFFTSHVHEQGTYFRVHNLARGLLRLGQDVTVFACDQAIGASERDEVRDGIRYSIVPESWKTSIFSQGNHPLTAMRRYLRNYPTCDVAHLFQPMLGAAAAWTRCRARVKFYDWDDQWTDGLFPTRPNSWRMYWPMFAVRRLESGLPRRADCVTTVGDYLANRAIDAGARRVTILYNGAWPAGKRDREGSRRDLGLAPEALYMGFMGYTTAELPWCLEGLEQNLERHPNLRFAQCGTPPDITHLPERVRSRIDLLGRISGADAQRFAQAIDLGLLPLEDNAFNQSRFPMKFAEHLRTGVPLICSEVGECGRLCRYFSWAVPAGKSKAEWLVALSNALDDAASGNLRPATDLSEFTARLSWESVVEQLLSAYRDELHGTDPAHANAGKRGAATFVN